MCLPIQWTSDALSSRHQHRFDFVRNPQGKVTERIRKVGESQVCTSIIVAAELRDGAERKASPKLSSQLEAALGALEVLPLKTPADIAYAKLRTTLERADTPIGANDLLIAAQGLALEYIVVTDNDKEFTRVQNLRCENWLR